MNKESRKLSNKNANGSRIDGFISPITGQLTQNNRDNGIKPLLSIIIMKAQATAFSFKT